MSNMQTDRHAAVIQHGVTLKIRAKGGAKGTDRTDDRNPPTLAGFATVCTESTVEAGKVDTAAKPLAIRGIAHHQPGPVRHHARAELGNLETAGGPRPCGLRIGVGQGDGGVILIPTDQRHI
jgi:hypothetical protein